MLAAGVPGGWLGVALWLLAMVFLGALLFRMRRWMADASGPTASQVWTLQDLRGMLADGRISQHEYEALRAQLMALAGRRASTNPAPAREKDDEAAMPDEKKALPDGDSVSPSDGNEIKPPTGDGR